jgi:hypothetical protein
MKATIRSRHIAFELGEHVSNIVNHKPRTGLVTRYKRGIKQEPIKVHSWEHSYPHSKRKRDFDNYIEVNGQGRTWSSLKQLEKDLGQDYTLVYRGCLGIWEVVGDEPIDCS